MSIILDLIIVGIIAVAVIIAANKGFVKSVVQIAGFVLAIVLSFMFSQPIAQFAYDKIVEPPVAAIIEETVDERLNETGENISNAVWDVLPEYVKNNSERLGLDRPSLEENLSASSAETGEAIAATVCDTVVEPIAVSFIKVIATLVLFIVLSILSRFLAKFLNGIFSFSIIGKANKLLGGVLGLVNGLIYAIIFILLTTFIISVSGGFLFFTNEAVADTFIFKNILNLLPSIF